MKHWLSQIELGKWYSNAQYYYRPRNDKERNLMHNCYEEGYNKGYEDNKLKWHDLRKDPDDIPKVNTYVLCINHKYRYEVGCRGYDYNHESYWFDISHNIVEPIAWCELPMFEE